MAIVQRTMWVLIVEDDVVDVKSIKQQFLKVNPRTEFYVAENGVEALDKLHGRGGLTKLDPPPSLIIVDIHMPKMDGNELVKTLRKDPQFNNTPIYLLTSTYSTKDKIATDGLDVSHVVKPLGPNDAIHMYMSALKLPGFNLEIE